MSDISSNQRDSLSVDAPPSISALHKGLGSMDRAFSPGEIGSLGWHLLREDLSLPTAVLYEDRLAHNLRLLTLPPYSPELKPVEYLWDDLREKSFHNRVFESIYALEHHLCDSLRDLELDHQRVRSVVAWPWIIDSLLN